VNWLSASAIGELLDMTPRQVRERIALRPDFPRPLRIGGVGHPRWREDEVQEWIERERQRTTGRERAA
jgi:predicted DNA-binding transcriptional regulator AlpA